MPWNEVDVNEQRMPFVIRAASGKEQISAPGAPGVAFTPGELRVAAHLVSRVTQTPDLFLRSLPSPPRRGGPAPTSRGHLPHIPAGHVTIPPLFHSPSPKIHFGVLFLCGNL